ncbi:MAG: glucose-6-phosphate isomerase family protein [Chloroflexota bacterium]|mgnify:CR=1 FL=1|nr:glucose-6-phosphate isomerase family protein [Chloroflexota bacterium]
MIYMPPFTKMVDLSTGLIENPTMIQERRLSDMRGLYADLAAEAALADANPLIYRVYEATTNPETPGQLRYSTTVIESGVVGDEYFMTKGHYHAKGECGELYFGLSGEGILILQTPEGEVNVQVMTAGAAAYVPPFWGHRTLNTGSVPFVFFACYPAEAGYDYGAIAEGGFASIVVARGGKTEIVPNPRSNVK